MQDVPWIVRRIREEITAGTVIPKPEARGDFVVKGWGTRRGEAALIYTIPNRRGGKPSEKGITVSEFESAWRRLASTGELTHRWFDETLQACAREGSCNFTTLGGLFVLLGYARYDAVSRGRYEIVEK